MQEESLVISVSRWEMPVGTWVPKRLGCTGLLYPSEKTESRPFRSTHEDVLLQEMRKGHQSEFERLQGHQALEYQNLKMNLVKPIPTSSAVSSCSTPSTVRLEEVSESSKSTGSTAGSFGTSTLACSTPSTTSTDTRERRGEPSPERTLSTEIAASTFVRPLGLSSSYFVSHKEFFPSRWLLLLLQKAYIHNSTDR